MIEIANKFITRPQQLGPRYTEKDGLGLFDGEEYFIHDCIIDMSNADDVDEAAAVTWGSSADFRRCVIRDTGKLFLCGSGDENKRRNEFDKTVSFSDCILEDFGRRGPEVQCGMQVSMRNCLIRNWGNPDYFDVRNFGAWAHDDGTIHAFECVFWQDKFSRPMKQAAQDIIAHIGQAVNDAGIIALLYPSTFLPGVCRALTATDGGEVSAVLCYKNHWWLKLENSECKMDEYEAKELIARLEEMRKFLERELREG